MNHCDPFGLVGRTISNTFRVEEFVAQGGYGLVYRAYHRHFRSPVALKVLKINEALGEQAYRQFWEELRKEAEVQFRLSALSPHVVRPFHIGEVDLGVQGFLPVMALEWLQGSDMGSESARRTASGEAPPSLHELVRRLSGVARAIHLSHNFESQGAQLSVVHRDLKPDNLFVARVGGSDVIKVLDFGISKVGRMANYLAGAPAATARAGQFSPAYAAPEQWVPDSLGQSGPWTDVWGLALTLVELMKGSHVFSGSMQKVLFDCLNEKERPTPRNHGLEVNNAIETVFAQALAVDPRQRTQSIRSFWLALRQALDQPSKDHRATAQSGPKVPAVRLVSVSEPPVAPSARIGDPQTGQFPVHRALDAAAGLLLRTGTDDDARDTIPDLYPSWAQR